MTHGESIVDHLIPNLFTSPIGRDYLDLILIVAHDLLFLTPWTRYGSERCAFHSCVTKPHIIVQNVVCIC